MAETPPINICLVDKPSVLDERWQDKKINGLESAEQQEIAPIIDRPVEIRQKQKKRKGKKRR